ncbi:hypothetical protein B0H14DRAFT_3540763, partial [Mycena olivaceomarginata]
MAKSRTRSRKKAPSPTSTVADDTLPKCLVPGRNMLSTEPGALTWYTSTTTNVDSFAFIRCHRGRRKMEDRVIMSIAREAAPYFRDFRDRFSDTTAELEMFLWSVVAAATPLSKRFPSAFSIDPSVESTETTVPYRRILLHPAALGPPYRRTSRLVRSVYGPTPTAFNSDFQIPHVVPVPVVYALPESDDEEEADRKVGDAEYAAGDDQPKQSLRRWRRLRAPPSPPALPRPNPGGTIHVKKEGAASVKTPATSTTPNRPTPRAAYRGAPSSAAAPPTPEAKQLFDDELLPNSSSKTSRKRPQVEIHTQGRPPSVETERLEQKASQGTVLSALSSAFFNLALPSSAVVTPTPPLPARPRRRMLLLSLPLGSVTLTRPLISRWSPHDAVAELTDGSLPDENTIACGTCAARGRTCEHKSLNSACDYCARGGQVSAAHWIGRHVCGSGSRDMVQHYAMLARTAHNFDRLCTEVVVLFNHQSSVLPLSHLEQMFEDPEDIQMLRELSERAAEALLRMLWRLRIATNGRWTTSGPDSSGLTYYARHNRDSTTCALQGVASWALSTFRPTFSSTPPALRSPTSTAPPHQNDESLVPKPETGTSSVQGLRT